MRSLILYRLATAIPLLVIVSAFTFILISLTPGDAASTILGASATEAQLQILRERLGLDLPLHIQYFNWLVRAVQLDFGQSLLNNQPVMAVILPRIAPTASLVGGTMIMTLVFGVALGVAGAVWSRTIGQFVDFLSMIGIALPNFIIAIGLTVFLAIGLHWFPPGGYVPPETSPGGWALGLVLPVLSLSFFSIGLLAKQVRASLTDALQSEYVQTLVANGFSLRSVVLRHALKNGSLPVLATAGVLFAGLISGTVLIESIFYIPGMGGLAVSATLNNDLPVLQAITVIFTLVVITINFLIDVTYGLLNPRIRTGA